ncbi:MAG: PKD domain-containing protein, partial [Bacteroidota bacterium]|nr:PKD domain-containing protein [Bacteroidota bacterium]MDX5429633.1 PKD domain-containing protein [Bacteroidota bacterium]MDX5468417.1 PKD domain-containing protein [Bacteroidota bacterium]
APAKISFTTNLASCDSVWFEFSNGYKTNQTQFSISFDTAGIYWKKTTLFRSGCIHERFDSVAVVLHAPKAKGRILNDTFCIPAVIALVNESEASPSVISKKWRIPDHGEVVVNADTSYFRFEKTPFNQRNGVNVFLELEDDRGCKSTWSHTVYPLNPKPQVSINEEFNCDETRHRLKILNLGKAGFEPVSYTWQTPLGSSNYTELLQSYPANQWHNILLISKDFAGCQRIDTFPVFVPKGKLIPDFSVSDTFSICPPLLVSFFDSSKSHLDPIVSWHWTFGDGSEAYVQNPKKNFILPGDYDIQLEITDAKGCQAVLQKKAYIQIGGPKTQIVIAPKHLCTNGEVFFDAKSDSGVKITWDFGDGNLAFTRQHTHQYQQHGFYLPVLSVESPDGCKYLHRPKDSIYVHPAPMFEIRDDGACAGQERTLQMANYSADAPAFSWIWQINGDTMGRLSSVKFLSEQPEILSVSLLVTDTLGCRNEITRTVEVPGINLNYSTSDTLLCIDEEASL